jgi:hypothetical protein
MAPFELQTETTIVQLPNFLPHRLWKMFPGTMSLLLSLMLPGTTVARKPEFPAAAVVKGITSTGYPYLSGGSSFDEQRAIDRMSGSYNLKLVLGRRFGLPASQVLLVIGTNQKRTVDRITVRQPWLYLRLPPGGYTIIARFEKQVVVIKNVFLREDRKETYYLRGD